MITGIYQSIAVPAIACLSYAIDFALIQSSPFDPTSNFHPHLIRGFQNDEKENRGNFPAIDGR